MKIKATARRAAESMLRRQAKPIRKLLLATGRDRSPIMPEIVQIESTNICNAKCVFCPRDEMERKQGVMSWELFKKIVDECADLGVGNARLIQRRGFLDVLGSPSGTSAYHEALVAKTPLDDLGSIGVHHEMVRIHRS